MQGMFDLILRGKKKDIERFRRESGIVDLPEYPSGLRDFSRDNELFPVDYDITADDDIVKYCFASDSSGNITGRDEWAEEVHKVFPELELLLNVTYLDYDNTGDVMYFAAGSMKCIRDTWSFAGYTIEMEDDSSSEQIDEKLEELREQGLDCNYDDCYNSIFVKDGGLVWSSDSEVTEQVESLMDKSELFSGYFLAQRRKERDILDGVCQKIDVAVSGSTFVLTGDFAHCNNDRDKVKALIESKGGRCTGAVSGKTSYLVIGSRGGFGEKKVEKAQALQEQGKDIKIIMEDTLFQFLK